MGKYIIDETTLSDIANAIREKSGITGEIILNESTYTSTDFNQFNYDNGVTEICVDLLDEGPVMSGQDFYQVTFNGTSYFCQPWVRWDGELCIGDSRLTYSSNDTPYNDHPEDVPFAIVGYYYNDDLGGANWGEIINEWGVWTLFVAQPEDCTIKITKMDAPIEPIPVKNFATEIKNMPGGLDIGSAQEKIHIIINYSLDDLSGAGTWQYFSVSGFEIQNNKIQYYGYGVPLSGSTGTSGTIEFDAPRNTGLKIATMGSHFQDSVSCDVSIQYKDSTLSENWYDCSLAQAFPWPEEVYLLLCENLPGTGLGYTDLRINVRGSGPIWM